MYILRNQSSPDKIGKILLKASPWFGLPQIPRGFFIWSHYAVGGIADAARHSFKFLHFKYDVLLPRKSGEKINLDI